MIAPLTWRLLAALVLTLPLPGLAAAPALPGDSVYLLENAFSDQSGKAFTLADRRG